MTPRELIARALHDRDERRAAIIAKRYPNARLSPWDDTPETAKEEWRREAAAALAAIGASGFKIVPVEPTEDQLRVGEQQQDDAVIVGRCLAASVYRAMVLAARPRDVAPTEHPRGPSP